MKFSIYSEYSEKEDFDALREIKFPSEIVIAATSLNEFDKRASEYEKSSSQVRKASYWPQLARSEGFWISPFSDKEALYRILGEMEERRGDSKLSVMLDLELPFAVNAPQMFRGISRFREKKRRIEDFIKYAKDRNIEITTAEPPKVLGGEKLQRLVGIAYDPLVLPHRKVPMVYTSLIEQFGQSIGATRKTAKRVLKKEARKASENFGENFGIGVGCTAQSENELDEKVLTPREFEEDLNILKEEGIENAYIYSLRGLNNPEFAEVMTQFSN